MAGLPTTFGSKPFRHNLAKQDSVEVARLRAAGAIVVGKTNAPEFGATGFTCIFCSALPAVHGISNAPRAGPRAAAELH